MPAFEEDYKAIEAARGKLSSLTETAGKQDAASATFRDDVMARVRQARADRGMTTLQQDLGNATTRLAAGRAQIRDRMGTTVNPLTVDSVTEAERAQSLGTLATISDIMSQREGTIDDIIGAGKNKMIAAATITKSQAEAAASELQGLLQLVQVKQQEAQRQIDNALSERKFQEDQRQFNETMAFNKSKEATNQTSTVPTTPTPTTPKPTSKPTSTPRPGVNPTPTPKLLPPAMSSRIGTQVENPKGSGVIWTMTANGWQ